MAGATLLGSSMVHAQQGSQPEAIRRLRRMTDNVVPITPDERKARIACQAFNVHRLIWPRLRKQDALTVYKYVSHKLLRWLSIYFLAAGCGAFLLGLSLSGHVGAAIALLFGALTGIAIGWKWSIAPFAQGTDVLLSLLGAGIGVWKSLRGESYQVWTPAASVRRAAEET